MIDYGLREEVMEKATKKLAVPKSKAIVPNSVTVPPII
jgi:hypothetical protein